MHVAINRIRISINAWIHVINVLRMHHAMGVPTRAIIANVFNTTVTYIRNR